jgi:hypothetical protein
MSQKPNFRVTDLEGRTWVYHDRQVAMDAARRSGGVVSGPMMFFSSPNMEPDLAGPIELNDQQRNAAVWFASRYAHQLLAMDTGLPDRHNPNGNYADKPNGKIDFERGVGSGLSQKDSNVTNVGSPTGAFLTKNLKEEEDDKHAVDEDTPWQPVAGGYKDKYIAGQAQKTTAPKRPPGAGGHVDLDGTDGFVPQTGRGGLPPGTRGTGPAVKSPSPMDADPTALGYGQQQKPPPGAPVKPGANGQAIMQQQQKPPKPGPQHLEQVDQHLDDQEAGQNQASERCRAALEQCGLDDDQIEQILQALFPDQQPDQDLADKHAELVDKNPNGGPPGGPGGRSTPSQPAQAEQDPIRKMSGDAAVRHHLKRRGNGATPSGVARARQYGERSPYWRALAMDQYANLCRDMSQGPPIRTEATYAIVGDRIRSRVGFG